MIKTPMDDGKYASGLHAQFVHVFERFKVGSAFFDLHHSQIKAFFPFCPLPRSLVFLMVTRHFKNDFLALDVLVYERFLTSIRIF